MKYTSIILLINVLFFGCAKDEKSYAYWDELANIEWSKIQELTKDYTCQDMDKLTLQTINSMCPFSLIVHTKDLERFEELHRRYQTYRTNALQADDAPLNYYSLIDCAPNMALKITCKDNKPTILTPMDLDLAQLNSQINELQEKIKHFYDDVTCTQSNDWMGSYFLVSDCKLEGAAMHKTIKTGEFNKLINLNNLCVYRKNKLEGADCNYKTPSQITLSCQQNKPQVDLH